MGAGNFDTRGPILFHVRINNMMHYLKELESEAIHIIREVAGEFRNPVMLYSIDKDSSVMVRLAQKAFEPARIPFPSLHVDTGYKFPEMIEFRDAFLKEIGARLIVERDEEGIADGIHPARVGMDRCCAMLKTRGLLHALKKYGFDAAMGGSRREEEKSRAKERIFSFRDGFGQWNPREQKPEVWDLYNARVNEESGECRSFLASGRAGCRTGAVYYNRCCVPSFFDAHLYDPYRINRATGSFILIDPATNTTVGAGMIRGPIRSFDGIRAEYVPIVEKPRSNNIVWQRWSINLEKRETRNGHKAAVMWLTGYSGSGKPAIADALEKRMFERNIRTMLLDGDNARHGLCSDLGF
jgi:hypothetical protein